MSLKFLTGLDSMCIPLSLIADHSFFSKWAVLLGAEPNDIKVRVMLFVYLCMSMRVYVC